MGEEGIGDFGLRIGQDHRMDKMGAMGSDRMNRMGRKCRLRTSAFRISDWRLRIADFGFGTVPGVELPMEGLEEIRFSPVLF